MLFFFFMSRRPPRSTPFPTRRSSDLVEVADVADPEDLPFERALTVSDRDPEPVAEGEHELGRIDAQREDRSEEHTSELQSHSDLVCRLLLEKKKIKNMPRQHIKK